MADRQTGITAVFTADLKALRDEYEAFRKEVTSRPVRVPMETERAGGGATPSGTFGGVGAGIAAVGPTAGERLDAMTVARASSAGYAAMQNGSPGLLPGNQGTNQAGTQLQQANLARQAGGFMSAERLDSYRAASDYSPGGPATDPFLSTPRIPPDAWRFARENMPRGGHGALPDFPSMPADSSRYRALPGETVDVGRPPQYALARRGEGPLRSFRQAEDPDIIDAEWADAGGSNGGGPPAGPRTAGGRRMGRDTGGREGYSPERLALATTIGFAVSRIAGAAGQFADAGQNPTGQTASLETRTRAERFAAVDSLSLGTGGLTSAIANYTVGRGFVSEGTRLGRQANLEDVGADTARRDIGNYYFDRANGSFNDPLKRKFEREGAIENAEADLKSNAALTDSSRPSGFNEKGEDAFRSRRQEIDLQVKAEDSRLSFESTQADFLTRRGTTAAVQQAGGQDLAGAIINNYAKQDDAVDRLYKSDPNYTKNVASAKRDFENQRMGLTSGFIMDNTRAGIVGSGQASASNLAMSGYTGAAMREQNNTQYASAMVGFDWGVDGNDRKAAMARYQGIYGQYQSGQKASQNFDRREMLGAVGSATSSGLRINDRPLDAQVNDIQDQERIAEIGVTNPIKLGILRGQRDNAVRGAKKSFEDQSGDIGVSQKMSGIALDRTLALDPVGANAAGIAGCAINEGRQLFRSQRPEQAEEARRQGMKRIDVEEQSYRLAFRGEEFDLRTIGISNARDSADPSAAFAQLAARKNDIANADFAGSNGGASGQLPAALATAVGGGKTLNDVVNALIALAGGP